MTTDRAIRRLSVRALATCALLVSAGGALADCPPEGCGSGGAISGGEPSLPFWGTDRTAPIVLNRETAVAAAEMSPEQVKDLAAFNKRRLALEKEMLVLRRKHFDNISNAKRRTEGLVALKKFTEPAAYPGLLTVFERDGHDVRGAVLDLLAAQKTSEADATLAWAALYDGDEWFRAEADKRLMARVHAEGGRTPTAVESAVASAFGTSDPETHTRAGRLAQNLGLIQAIPAMIQAQAGQTTAGFGGRAADDGYLGTIIIGRQFAFIADLTPIVGDSAVGFDPEVAIATEGVVMNIQDAVVTWRNVALHNQLQGWTSMLTGKSTAGLGYDLDAWREWYASDFRPQVDRQARLAQALRAGADAADASRTPAGAR